MHSYVHIFILTLTCIRAHEHLHTITHIYTCIDSRTLIRTFTCARRALCSIFFMPIYMWVGSVHIVRMADVVSFISLLGR